MNRPDIAQGRIDLWYTFLDRAADPHLLDRYFGLLDADERARVQRLRLEHVRQEYLVTRALVRTALSHYAGNDPSQWTFTQNAYGKPIVDSPWRGYESFNLSHSAGLVICAVAAEGRVGVDVESVCRKNSGIALAKRFFAAPEVVTLEATPEARQQEVFIQIWTLKEAYIKAIGHGLSVPLDSFHLALDDQRPPSLYHAATPEAPSSEWRFVQIRLAGQHHVSLAVSEPHLRKLVLKAREVIPLVGQRPEHSIDCDRACPSIAIDR